jgi:YqaJ-like viral recombinase domain
LLSFLQVTAEKRQSIELETRGQATNPLWFSHKKGRITASQCKQFCTGKSAVSRLTAAVINIGKPRSTGIPSLQYGIDNEACAIAKYKIQRSQHSQHAIDVTTCGLFVDLEYGQLAATPDGLVYDPTSADPDGLVEVKCLYSCKDMTPTDAVEMKQRITTFPVRDVGGHYIVKEVHPYYYQMQMQMAITRRKWCDFVLFTAEQWPVLVIRIQYDDVFWAANRKKLLDFHSMYIIPALVAQGFYKG